MDGSVFKAGAGEMACNRCFQALLACMEPVSYGSFSIAMLTAHTTKENRPDVEWLQSVYKTIDSRSAVARVTVCPIGP